MTAKWKWGTIYLHGVSDFDESRDVKRAELFKLDSTESTYHYFGAGSRKTHIKGMVIGTADRDSIKLDAISNIPRTVTTPWETITNCLINGTPKFTTHKYSGATIDGVTYTADVTPIYDFDAEIIALNDLVVIFP